ncbi:carboxymuconolactone decarboxylase family protein [Croceimicrobium hydrocarbonivorans]|uniref:Carboxymuconolactone decarboxylase family protein n=1 Tax=Croceimicrobium hydrocarbonivorans TaxID=2761580 RepID=A0A7H0VFS7_9FLAO|nr:carboxymuconolactone decarboxylase family protein [Croceimicrobium hydrocarbonivorans]QNR24575.1 carboxymuconolactone decarboxylase family protein [Croceimicrobium hydrocarbonivorans]
MNTFDVPERHEVAEANQQIFDNLKSKLGFVPNLYASMAHSDTGLANYLQFQGAKTSFSNKEKEVINLVVSEFNQCKYCQAAHTAIGKMNGFSDEQILDIRSAQINWDSKLAALGRLSLAIVASKGKNVDKELSDFYEAGYDRGSLVDLVLAVADKIVMNYLHNIIQIPVDFPAAPELEEALS